MKKLLSLIAAFGLTATSASLATTVVSCQTMNEMFDDADSELSSAKGNDQANLYISTGNVIMTYYTNGDNTKAEKPEDVIKLTKDTITTPDFQINVYKMIKMLNDPNWQKEVQEPKPGSQTFEDAVKFDETEFRVVVQVVAKGSVHTEGSKIKFKFEDKLVKLSKDFLNKKSEGSKA